MKQMTYGADPEFFLRDSNGSPVPVCGWLGGTKEEHVPLEDGVEIHEDGCAAELTFPPQNSPLMMRDYAHHALRMGLEHIRMKRKVELVASPQILLTKETLERIGPAASRFGCSSEYDCYTGGTEAEPVIPERLMTPDGALRFAGGHLHIGYRAVRPEVDEYVVAMLCDAAIGLRLIRAGEMQGKRRELYGQPGRFRPTPYGLEYRVPSNRWLYDPTMGMAVVDGLNVLSEWMYSSLPALRSKWNSLDWVSIRDAISREDRVLAGQISL